MIVEAKYLGPFDSVTIPQMPNKRIVQGETIKIRIDPGILLPPCWEITKGKDEYEAGLKAAEDARAQAAAARSAQAEKTAAVADAALSMALGTGAAEPKSDKKGG